MSDPGHPTKARRLARGLFPVAEILAVLIVGNLLGALTLKLLIPLAGIDPALLQAELPTGDWLGHAKAAAVSLVARFGWLLLLAYLVLRFIHGIRPREAGVGRGGHPLGRLIAAGVLLFAFAWLPFRLVFVADSLIDFGQGLEAWRMWSSQQVTFAYVLFNLAALVILPPLFEEPFARGYMRVRFEKDYGAVGGVILAGIMFIASHGHFYAPDGVVLAAFAAAAFAAICWGWVTYRTQSIIPAMVAHSLGNLALPIEGPVLYGSVTVMVVILLVGRSRVSTELGVFRAAVGTAPIMRIATCALAIMGLLLLIVRYGEIRLPLGLLALLIAIASWLPAVRRWAYGQRKAG